MGDTSPSKKFKLDQALDETTDDHIATQTLFKAYQRGELSTSILSRDDSPTSNPQPLSSSSSSSRLPSASSISSCRLPSASSSSSSRLPSASSSSSSRLPSAASSTRHQLSSAPRPQTGCVNTSEKPQSSLDDQPTLPTSPSKRPNTACLLVNARQRGNPILKFIRNVAWEFVEMEPDYVMSRNTCALYLSLRYHNFNPNYIDGRIQKLGRSFELRVLLVQVDVTEPYAPLKELTRVSILTNMTLMVAWTAEEAGRYLETYKALENKPADLIKEKISTNFLSQAEDFLTSIRSVNKTDTSTLLTHFGSMEAIMKAEVEELSSCPGLGVQKAKRIYEIFRTPFPRSSR